MRNLILLMLNYGHVFVFLTLEVLCLVLIVNFNKTHGDIWLNSTNIFSGKTASVFDSWTDYLNLKEEAEKLATENAKLRARLFNESTTTTRSKEDTTKLQDPQYLLIPAKIINKSINQPDNYFTLNKGSNDGIRPGMGVVSSKGIVGIVTNTSEDFSGVLTILHRQSNIVVENKRNAAFGTLKWRDFSDYKHIQLEAYPRHESLNIGDTIVTSGHSMHFPEGIMIGKVDTVILSKSDYFYKVKVALNNNLSTVKYVYVIQNLKKQQQQQLEEKDGKKSNY